MKILMEKPTPSISTQADNTAATNPDLFEMLSACLFTDVMSAADQNEQASTPDHHEEIENNEPSPSGLTSTLDTMQIMVEEMLLQASTYQTPQTTPQPGGQMNAETTRTNLDQQKNLPTEQPTNNQSVTETNRSTNKMNVLATELNTDTQAETDTHELEEKLTAIQKKLTPSVKSNNQTEINQTMNQLSSTTQGAQVNDHQASRTQIESQSKTLKKTLETWTQNVNAANESAPIITPAAQPTREFSDMLATRQTAKLAENTKPTPMAMELEHIEPSTSQPGTFHVKIKVNPPELGAIHASIKMNNNKVEIQIMTSNNHTEQVVKAHLSALTAQFSESSMQLNTVVVQQQSLSHGGYEHQSSHEAPDETNQQGLQPTIKPTQADDKKESKSNKLIDAYI